MLAYSSMENMGLIAIAAAAGTHAGDRRAAAARARARHRQDRAVPGGRSAAGRARLHRDRRHQRCAAALPADRRRHSRSGWSCCSGCRRSRCSPANWPSPASLADAAAGLGAGRGDGCWSRSRSPPWCATPARCCSAHRARGAPTIAASGSVAAALLVGVAVSIALGVTAGPLTDLFTTAAVHVGALR